jgi:hypothetical protein
MQLIQETSLACIIFKNLEEIKGTLNVFKGKFAKADKDQPHNSAVSQY